MGQNCVLLMLVFLFKLEKCVFSKILHLYIDRLEVELPKNACNFFTPIMDFCFCFSGKQVLLGYILVVWSFVYFSWKKIRKFDLLFAEIYHRKLFTTQPWNPPCFSLSYYINRFSELVTFVDLWILIRSLW